VTVVVDDAEALELGLTCGAEFDLLIEPLAIRENDPTIAAYESAVRASRTGKASYVVTTMASGKPRRDVVFSSDDVPADAVFVERIAPPDTLVLVGASDVAAALAGFAHTLGLRVIAVDGRERYATRERFPRADEILVGMPSELVRPYLTAGTFVVLAAHEYKYELPVLREALRSPARFVGMLAGRKRAQAVKTLLREGGLTDEEVARLHSPIGLDIGGREPEEIALSIAAQLVAAREGKPIARRQEAPSDAPAPASRGR
jgi:xanthine/CO dehydrogenase XdhC/CoxF family maturation factor